jgi:hypothetical protein
MSTPSLKRAQGYQYDGQQNEDRDEVTYQASAAGDMTITPSQAEGDREAIERDLRKKNEG